MATYLLSCVSYPFSLIRTDGVEEGGLGIDVDSGLVVDDGSGEGVEWLFEADLTLASTTKSIAELVHFSKRDQVATARAVSAFSDAGLIKPWPLTMQVGDQQISVSGLNCIDEAVLRARRRALSQVAKSVILRRCLWAAAFHGARA